MRWFAPWTSGLVRDLSSEKSSSLYGPLLAFPGYYSDDNKRNDDAI